MAETEPLPDLAIDRLAPPDSFLVCPVVHNTGDATPAECLPWLGNAVSSRIQATTGDLVFIASSTPSKGGRQGGVVPRRVGDQVMQRLVRTRPIVIPGRVALGSMSSLLPGRALGLNRKQIEQRLEPSKPKKKKAKLA